ncbi:hypothetical protein ACFV2H_11090 [Streptomyces sp. NPDC059629]|uniref:hypothetical protein n=1 Tax=Streptomyces sp. NPDC059629 TaxID=3346889 RepID=UPI00367375FD
MAMLRAGSCTSRAGRERAEAPVPLAATGALAGTALAAHFATFMSSTRMTSVAMATALVATQPVWQALVSTFQGHLLPRATWAGLGVSVGARRSPAVWTGGHRSACR